jgi:hypothetical protein
LCTLYGSIFVIYVFVERVIPALIYLQIRPTLTFFLKKRMENKTKIRFFHTSTFLNGKRESILKDIYTRVREVVDAQFEQGINKAVDILANMSIAVTGIAVVVFGGSAIWLEDSTHKAAIEAHDLAQGERVKRVEELEAQKRYVAPEKAYAEKVYKNHVFKTTKDHGVVKGELLKLFNRKKKKWKKKIAFLKAKGSLG